jgi:regulator of sigma D
MFNFFKKFFGNKESKLIKILENDHKELLKIYNEMVKKSREMKYNEVKNLLKQFLVAYKNHILLEDTKLYIGLQDKYKDYFRVAKMIDEMQKEMNGITRTVTMFVRKYENDLNYSNLEEFSNELSQIGQALGRRITTEEERLYPLFSD